MATKSSKKTTSHDYFSQAFLDEMKGILTIMLKETETELSSFTHKGEHGAFEADFPDYGTEEDDDVKEVEAFMVNKPMQLVLEKKYRDIQKALKSIDTGTYGICKYTGEPIDERRLRARPTSSSSVAAKKLLTDEA
jgi:RNA polymerase-binding transcription factor DksA